MSLRPLNRDPKYMSGPYAGMFDIPIHQGNARFTSSPYRPGVCRPEDIACFSLTRGNEPCTHDPANLLVWRSTGELAKLPMHARIN